MPRGAAYSTRREQAADELRLQTVGVVEGRDGPFVVPPRGLGSDRTNKLLALSPCGV